MSFKIAFKKSLGQHLLKNPGIVDSMVKKSDIRPTDTVLEIGGGTGNLTLKLLEKAKKVIVIEKDRVLANELLKRAAEKNLKDKLKLIIGDALREDFPYFDLCVANIPYQISSPLIFKLMEHNHRGAILMVQKEFSERLTARPGSPLFCRLSLTVQLWAKPQHLIKVGRTNFNPPPKVDSAVVLIEPRKKIGIDFKEFDFLARCCFLRKNKILASIFKTDHILQKLNLEKTQVQLLLEKLDMTDKRANKLDVEDFLLLMLEMKKIGANLK